MWCSASSTAQQYLCQPWCCAVKTFVPCVMYFPSVFHRINHAICVHMHSGGTAKHCICTTASTARGGGGGGGCGALRSGSGENGAGAISVAPHSLYSAMPAHRHARQCPAKTPWDPWPHLICALSAFSLQCTPFSYLWRFCRLFHLVYSHSLYLAFCAFSVVVPAEDCFAILCRPQFTRKIVNLLSSENG